MNHFASRQNDPYRSPADLSGAQPRPHGPSRWRALRPSAFEAGFLFLVAGISGYSHFSYDQIQAILHTNATLSAIVVVTILLALVGCGLAATRYQVSPAKRILAAIGGVCVAAIVTVCTCWTLIRTGQPPHGFTLLVSVAMGMAATALLVCPRLGNTPRLRTHGETI